MSASAEAGSFLSKAEVAEWPLIARVRVWQAHDTGAAAETDEAALRAAPDELVAQLRTLAWSAPLPPIVYCRAVTDTLPP
ncbi:MAG: hypothetical protein ACPGUV_11105, partial [Polyangiales bacterium]